MNCFLRGLSSGFLILLFTAGATAQGERSSLSAPPIASRLLIDAREPKPLWRPEEQALRPFDLFKECPVCPEMVMVPSGEFMMGAPDGEESSEDNEKPQHRVSITKP